MSITTRSIVEAALGAALAMSMAAPGCSRNAPAATANTAGRADDGANARASSPRNARAGAELDSACQLESVYFAFDSSDLDAHARNQIESNKRCITSRNAAQVQVTGMADPRGTEEYNLALGDRRARQVASYMARLGVSESAIEVHSVGEEMASGADEPGWSRDRRADLEAH